MRRATKRASFGKGVLDKALLERNDLAHYGQAVLDAENCQAMPQSGLKRIAGTRASGSRIRRHLQPVPFGAGDVVIHNGGTVANLIDQDAATLFTTNAVGSASFVVVEIDLGAQVLLSAVDLIAFKCATSRADNAIGVEYWSGGGWVPLGMPDEVALSPRRHLRTSSRTRRFATRPGDAIATRHIRVLVSGGIGLGAISLGGLRLWADKPALLRPRYIDFARSTEEVYELALGDRNIDVYEAGKWIAAIPVPIGGGMVAEVNVEASQDTVFLYHQDVATQVITRQGAKDEWNAAPAVFTNVPTVSTQIAFTGTQDEVQTVTLAGVANGQSIALWLGDLVAPTFIYFDAATAAAQIAAALGAIPGVNNTGISVALATLAPSYTVRFVGANGGRAWPRIEPVVSDVALVLPPATVVQRGVKSDGPLFGAENGYSRCGVLYQSRHIQGGFRAAPQTVLFGVVGNPYDVATTGSPLTADKGFIRTLDTDRLETITEMVVGRHLQIFTEAGVWWTAADTLDATKVPSFQRATSYGITNGVPVVFADTTLFCQEGGRTIRDLAYSDATQSYEAGELTLLAPHLISGTADMAWRPAATVGEGNLLYVVNADGTVALLTLLKTQEIVAWTPLKRNDAKVRAAVCNVRREVWLAVEAAGDLWHDRVDDQLFLDECVEYAGAAVSNLTLGGRYAGRTLWAVADGDVVGPLIADAVGTITLPRAASQVTAGIDNGIRITPLPMRPRANEEPPFKPPVRIYETELSLLQTGALAFAANGGPAEEVALRHFDGGPDPALGTGEEPSTDLLDAPLLSRLYSGSVTLEQLEGWTENGQWQITQPVPAPLWLRAIRLEYAHRG